MWAIGIDLGATKIEVAGIDSSGVVLKHLRRSTNVESSVEKIEAEIIEMARDIIGSVGFKPKVAGVGMAGQIDPKKGMVIFSPNLSWHNIPLQEVLAKELGIPVAVTNDVRAAAWGEWLYGAGRGYNDIVCIFVGTGIGGGIISNGLMLAGCSNSAGEVGHITIDRNGPVCTCHNKGCLEAIAGGWAIARDAQKAAVDDPIAGAAILDLANGNPQKITAKIVAMAAHNGDTLALKIVERVADALIAGAVSLVNAFNPCMLILGGGVIEGLPELVGIIDKGIRSRALGTATLNLKVVQSHLHNYAGVIGAAAFAIHTFTP
jgi:glucokinase